MRFSKQICNNLRFLVAEVRSQVSSLQDYLEKPTATHAQLVIDRSGYAYNLMLRIHENCHNQVFRWWQVDLDVVYHR